MSKARLGNDGGTVSGNIELGGGEVNDVGGGALDVGSNQHIGGKFAGDLKIAIDGNIAVFGNYKGVAHEVNRASV